MAIKPKQTQTPAQGQAPVLSEERQQRINPEVDARLTQFMEANSKNTEYYRNLVKENPERAVRSLMLNRMFKHEDRMRLVEKQMPLVKEWVEQTPGMMERIMQRIQKVNPFYKERAFVSEAMRQQSRHYFTAVKPGVRITP